MPAKPRTPHALALPTRRQVLIAGASAGAALLLPRSARAATISFSYDCDLSSAFLGTPNVHKRVGYITDLAGLGLPGPLAKDLQVRPAYAGTPSDSSMSIANGVAKVVGVLEKFSWDGSVGGAISLTFYTSQQNAVQLKAAQQKATPVTTISALGFWIVNYDEEKKVWYEQVFPTGAGKVSGVVGPKDNPLLNVDVTPAPIVGGIASNVYKISVSVTPAANQTYQLHLASTSSQPMTKQWGLQVGSLAAGAQ